MGNVTWDNKDMITVYSYNDDDNDTANEKDNNDGYNGKEIKKKIISMIR